LSWRGPPPLPPSLLSPCPTHYSAPRITQTEDTIRKLEEAQLEQENNLFRDCAGGVRCISCGSLGKGSGAHNLHITPEPNIDLSSGRNAGGDYDQLLAVLNRHAGLKPLSRQTKPLVPMTTPVARPSGSNTTTTVMSPILKKGQGQSNQEAVPLYRRAKAVSMMKEIPKIPLVSFGPSSSGNPADVYHYDQGGSSSALSPSSSSPSPSPSSSSINSRVRLPRVPAIRSNTSGSGGP
jgi:hypothetical protein